MNRYMFYPNIVSHCSEHCWSFFIDGKLECDCGNDFKIFEWFWAEDDGEPNFKLDPRTYTVTFHPIYSSGTSVVRSEEPFLRNKHYYWEVKIISKLYGTDVMVGVGTKEGIQNLTHYRFRFCSMLGSDDQTWGYSYHGNIQHDKLIRKYGKPFGLASLVGVHLDMYSGKLEYYLDRKPLGLAFSDLKDKVLYPMASATAAQTSMRLTCSMSQEQTLQMLCLEKILQNSYLYEKYRSIPGLFKSCSERYFWMYPNFSLKPSQEEEEDYLYSLALINNSSKRKQHMNSMVNPPSNKKHSTDEGSSSRDTSPVGRPEICQRSMLIRMLNKGLLPGQEDDSP